MIAPTDDLLTTREAAEMLSSSSQPSRNTISFVRVLCRTGLLDCHKTGGRYYPRRWSVQRWLRGPSEAQS